MLWWVDLGKSDQVWQVSQKCPFSVLHNYAMVPLYLYVIVVEMYIYQFLLAYWAQNPFIWFQTTDHSASLHLTIHLGAPDNQSIFANFIHQ